MSYVGAKDSIGAHPNENVGKLRSAYGTIRHEEATPAPQSLHMLCIVNRCIERGIAPAMVGP